MRIAFSGSHQVGKSTLLSMVAERLPQHVCVDEPYFLLEEEGYECAEQPSLEDFEAQLERSLEVIEEGHDDVLFDRCPADIVAYLQAHEDADELDLDDKLERVHDAMQSLDLVVFVPIEADDRIALAAHEDANLRRRVHRKLRDLLLEDGFGWDVEVLVVEGSREERAKQVIEHCRQFV